MSKRLQVVLEDEEMLEIQEVARRQRMTMAEWVRQALRAAKRGHTQKKLDVIRSAASHAHPAPDIEQMLAEIEQGYLSQDQ
jgi:hypothetical protein